MTRLIGCMMAMNVADILDLSLGSLRGEVDDLVLVDGGSTDGTMVVARGIGATVIESKWPDNNSVQRQVYLDYALALARDDDDTWALVLDADEILTGGSPKAAIADLNRHSLDFAMLPRKWLVDPPQGLSYLSSYPHYPDRQLRLFRLRPSLRYTGTIHEVLHGVGSGRDVDTPTILHLDLLRAGYDHRARKVRRYDESEPGSGLPRFYLFERYGFTVQPLQSDAYIQPLLARIKAITLVTLTPDDLRGKGVQYRFMRRPLDLSDWVTLKARRLPGRLKRVGRTTVEWIRKVQGAGLKRNAH